MGLPFQKKRVKKSITNGNHSFEGYVNQHRVLIQKEPLVIYEVLTDFNQFRHWVPLHEISVEKMSSGGFGLGTRFRFKLRFRIQPEWETEVIHLERGKQIVYRFLNGIFEGGIEIWDLKKNQLGTEVTHTLLYQIKRWSYRMGWFLLGGERKHNELTEVALHRLKSLLEEKPS